MDRKLVYPTQIPLETDLLGTNRFAMIALGKLAEAMLGTDTAVNGLACTPTAPASMEVQVAAGEIYSLENVDSTAFSTLEADTTHQIIKQGLMPDAITLSCPAPATSGHSVAYLVQARYQDVDSDPLALPYYNASNPTQPYSGPNNSGTAQNTLRKGVCVVSVKTGISATTGSQTTPAPDAGNVGLYVVTVANGQTTITSSHITAASGAPLLLEKLADKISQTTADARYALASFVNASLPVLVGSVMYFATQTAPTGWLKANGAAVSRTAYAALYAAIGTTFGAGDGSTTFNLPDLRGEFLRAFDDGRGVDAGRVFGTTQKATLNVFDPGITSVGVGGPIGADDNAAAFLERVGVDSVSANAYDGVKTALTVTGTTATDLGGLGWAFGGTRPRNVALLACIKY